MRSFVPAGAFALALLSAALVAPARASVSLSVRPETLSVAPGATFTLELRVPVAGDPFNGFDAVVEYEPSKLTFLPTSPTSLQQGADMTAACGSTFHLFRAAGDSLAITDVILCDGLSLNGPALLYTVRFRAATTPGATHVRLRRAQFYDAGYFVGPVVTRDATISWGVVLDVPAAPPVLPRLTVTANPARGEQWLELASPAAGEQRLALFDAGGRRVRQLDAGARPAGNRRLRWDGRDDRGRLAPPGVYLVRFDTPGGSAHATLVRLP